MIPIMNSYSRLVKLRWAYFLALLLWSLPGYCQGYRMGDAVDTDVSMDGFLWDALRSQMPKFGINTKVHFEMEIPEDYRPYGDQNLKQYKSFTLLFEDGLRSIETRSFENYRREQLERVVVKFIYSKSGTGMIHSVSSTAVYKPASSIPSAAKGRFRVEYEWQEEEAVRLSVGTVVMFLAVFLSSIVFLFQSCGMDGSYDEGHDETQGLSSTDEYGRPSTSAYTDHKKW